MVSRSCTFFESVICISETSTRLEFDILWFKKMYANTLKRNMMSRKIEEMAKSFGFDVNLATMLIAR